MPRIAAGPPAIRPIRPVARRTDVGRAPNPFNCSTQPAGAVFNDILTLGSGGPETAPIATRHAQPPDMAEQEDP